MEPICPTERTHTQSGFRLWWDLHGRGSLRGLTQSPGSSHFQSQERGRRLLPRLSVPQSSCCLLKAHGMHRPRQGKIRGHGAGAWSEGQPLPLVSLEVGPALPSSRWRAWHLLAADWTRSGSPGASGGRLAREFPPGPVHGSECAGGCGGPQGPCVGVSLPPPPSQSWGLS